MNTNKNNQQEQQANEQENVVNMFDRTSIEEDTSEESIEIEKVNKEKDDAATKEWIEEMDVVFYLLKKMEEYREDNKKKLSSKTSEQAWKEFITNSPGVKVEWCEKANKFNAAKAIDMTPEKLMAIQQSSAWREKRVGYGFKDEYIAPEEFLEKLHEPLQQMQLIDPALKVVAQSFMNKIKLSWYKIFKGLYSKEKKQKYNAEIKAIQTGVSAATTATNTVELKIFEVKAKQAVVVKELDEAIFNGRMTKELAEKMNTLSSTDQDLIVGKYLQAQGEYKDQLEILKVWVVGNKKLTSAVAKSIALKQLDWLAHSKVLGSDKQQREAVNIGWDVVGESKGANISLRELHIITKDAPHLREHVMKAQTYNKVIKDIELFTGAQQPISDMVALMKPDVFQEYPKDLKKDYELANALIFAAIKRLNNQGYFYNDKILRVDEKNKLLDAIKRMSKDNKTDVHSAGVTGICTLLNDMLTNGKEGDKVNIEAEELKLMISIMEKTVSFYDGKFVKFESADEVYRLMDNLNLIIQQVQKCDNLQHKEDLQRMAQKYINNLRTKAEPYLIGIENNRGYADNRTVSDLREKLNACMNRVEIVVARKVGDRGLGNEYERLSDSERQSSGKAWKDKNLADEYKEEVELHAINGKQWEYDEFKDWLKQMEEDIRDSRVSYNDTQDIISGMKNGEFARAKNAISREEGFVLVRKFYQNVAKIQNGNRDLKYFNWMLETGLSNFVCSSSSGDKQYELDKKSMIVAILNGLFEKLASSEIKSLELSTAATRELVGCIVQYRADMKENDGFKLLCRQIIKNKVTDLDDVSWAIGELIDMKAVDGEEQQQLIKTEIMEKLKDKGPDSKDEAIGTDTSCLLCYDVALDTIVDFVSQVNKKRDKTVVEFMMGILNNSEGYERIALNKFSPEQQAKLLIGISKQITEKTSDADVNKLVAAIKDLEKIDNGKSVEECWRVLAKSKLPQLKFDNIYIEPYTQAKLQLAAGIAYSFIPKDRFLEVAQKCKDMNLSIADCCIEYNSAGTPNIGTEMLSEILNLATSEEDKRKINLSIAKLATNLEDFTKVIAKLSDDEKIGVYKYRLENGSYNQDIVDHILKEENGDQLTFNDKMDIVIEQHKRVCSPVKLIEAIALSKDTVKIAPWLEKIFHNGDLACDQRINLLKACIGQAGSTEITAYLKANITTKDIIFHGMSKDQIIDVLAYATNKGCEPLQQVMHAWLDETKASQPWNHPDIKNMVREELDKQKLQEQEPELVEERLKFE